MIDDMKKISDLENMLMSDADGIVEPSDLKCVFAPRAKDSHKGTFGYTALIGGSRAYSGAAKLANMSATAMAALRSGTGVVKLAVPESLADAVMPYILESTLYALPEKDGHIAFDAEAIDGCLKGTRAAAIGMGIGMSEDVKAALSHILETYEGVLIIDADGLNMLAELLKENSRILNDSKCKVILTPHLKEFSRLSGLTIDEIKAEPVRAARGFAAENGCVVLLKGPTTIITDGGRTLLVDRGCPGMATAGSGDVLSGIITAICGYSQDDLVLAASAAAYVNGAAGEAAQEEYGDISMVASDTVKMIPRAIKSIISYANIE